MGRGGWGRASTGGVGYLKPGVQNRGALRNVVGPIQGQGQALKVVRGQSPL